MEREAAPVDGQFVYYARKNGLIKIGFTADILRRMEGLQPMALEAVEAGPLSLETARHRQFVDDRARGRDWFQPSRSLMRHIAECSARRPVPDLDSLMDCASTLTGRCPQGHFIIGPNYQPSRLGGHTCKACFQTQIAMGVARRKGLPFDRVADLEQRYARLMDGYDNPLTGAA